MSFEIFKQISELGEAMTTRAAQIGVEIEVKINGQPMKMVNAADVKRVRKPSVKRSVEEIEADKECITQLVAEAVASKSIKRDVVLSFKKLRPGSAGRFYQRLNNCDISIQQTFHNLPTNGN